MASGHNIATIGIIAAAHKPEAVRWAGLFAQRLAELGIAVKLAEALAPHCSGEYSFGDRAFLAESDLIIVLGGDGTLLSMARCAGPAGTPLVGLDVGSFGFLAKHSPEAALKNLEAVISGDLCIDERMMLQATVQHADGSIAAEDSALNEVVIASSDGRRVVSLQTWVDGEAIGTYCADGVMVATPTGSTGYNLSAGGPIIDPRMSCMVLTAICPHTLCSRPLLLPDSVEVRIGVPADGKRPGQILATVDGQESYVVGADCTVAITKATHRARLVRLRPESYFTNLVDKLMPGLAE